MAEQAAGQPAPYAVARRELRFANDEPLGLRLVTTPDGKHTVVPTAAQGQAARAGLRLGDVLTTLNGEDVSTYAHQDILVKLQTTPRPFHVGVVGICLLYTSPSPRDRG